jgi:hypothetical protein
MVVVTEKEASEWGDMKTRENVCVTANYHFWAREFALIAHGASMTCKMSYRNSA